MVTARAGSSGGEWGPCFSISMPWWSCEIARVLLSQGADPNIADWDGEMAPMRAGSKGHEECVALIR